MTDTNKDTIKVLNDLIETSLDGKKGFEDLAEHAKDEQLRQVFLARASDTSRAASELQGLVRTLGGDPEDSTSVAGDLHRRWVDLKSLVTGKDEAALLNEAERGEDVAKKRYKDALEKDLPANVRAVVEKQYQGVLQNHDQIKALRDQARARK